MTTTLIDKPEVSADVRGHLWFIPSARQPHRWSGDTISYLSQATLTPSWAAGSADMERFTDKGVGTAVVDTATSTVRSHGCHQTLSAGYSGYTDRSLATVWGARY